MIQIGDKEYRELTEQVGKNMTDIQAIKQALGNALPDPIPGPDGPQGVGVSSVQINGQNHLIITLTNGVVQDAGEIATLRGERGLKGNDGPVGKQIQDMTAIDSSDYAVTVDPAIDESDTEVLDTSADVEFGDVSKPINFKLKYLIPKGDAQDTPNTFIKRDMYGKAKVEDEISGKFIANGNVVKQCSGRKNVIINPNFLINQRGEYTYSAHGYTVDRWKFTKGAGTVSDVLRGIKLQPDQYNTIDIEQPLVMDILGLAVALTIKANDGDPISTFEEELENSAEDQCILNGGAYSAYLKMQTNGSFNLVIHAAVETTINWVKLEVSANGKIYPTKYTPPIFSEELLKCQRYYQRISTNCLPVVAYSSGTAGGAIQLITTMDRLPTVVVNTMPTIGWDSPITITSITTGLYNAESNQVTLAIYSQQNMTSDKIYMLDGGDISLDAEINP